MRQDELADLMKIDKSQIKVVPNGVDINKFFKLEEQTQGYIKKLGLIGSESFITSACAYYTSEKY